MGIDNFDEKFKVLRVCSREITQLRSEQFDDKRVRIVEFNLHESIKTVFGLESAEYTQYKDYEILDRMIFLSGPVHQVVNQKFQSGIETSLMVIKNLVKRLQAQKIKMEASPAKEFTTIMHGFPVHPRIADASKKLYEDGHFDQAVNRAATELINFVKELTPGSDKDGTGLMFAAFGGDAPLIKLNALETDAETDEQQGFCHLFAGTILGIRNPRAHSSLNDTPEVALEYIILISMLAKRLDQHK